MSDIFKFKFLPPSTYLYLACIMSGLLSAVSNGVLVGSVECPVARRTALELPVYRAPNTMPAMSSLCGSEIGDVESDTQFTHSGTQFIAETQFDGTQVQQDTPSAVTSDVHSRSQSVLRSAAVPAAKKFKWSEGSTTYFIAVKEKLNPTDFYGNMTIEKGFDRVAEEMKKVYPTFDKSGHHCQRKFQYLNDQYKRLKELYDPTGTGSGSTTKVHESAVLVRAIPAVTKRGR